MAQENNQFSGNGILPQQLNAVTPPANQFTGQPQQIPNTIQPPAPLNVQPQLLPPQAQTINITPINPPQVQPQPQGMNPPVVIQPINMQPGQHQPVQQMNGFIQQPIIPLNQPQQHGNPQIIAQPIPMKVQPPTDEIKRLKDTINKLNEEITRLNNENNNYNSQLNEKTFENVELREENNRLRQENEQLRSALTMYQQQQLRQESGDSHRHRFGKKDKKQQQQYQPQPQYQQPQYQQTPYHQPQQQPQPQQRRVNIRECKIDRKTLPQYFKYLAPERFRRVFLPNETAEFIVTYEEKNPRRIEHKMLYPNQPVRYPMIFLELENETVLAVFSEKIPRLGGEEFMEDEKFMVAVLMYNGEFKKATFQHNTYISFDSSLQVDDQEVMGVSAFFSITKDAKIQFIPEFFNELDDYIIEGDLKQLHPDQKTRVKQPIKQIIVGHW